MSHKAVVRINRDVCNGPQCRGNRGNAIYTFCPWNIFEKSIHSVASPTEFFFSLSKDKKGNKKQKPASLSGNYLKSHILLMSVVMEDRWPNVTFCH